MATVRSITIVESGTAVENTETTKIAAGDGISAGTAPGQHRQVPSYLWDHQTDSAAVEGAGGKERTLSSLTPKAQAYAHGVELEAKTAQMQSGHQDSEGSAHLEH